LFVKLIPATQDSIASKTIYIRDIDEDCRPLDSYTEVLVECDADMKEIYEGKGSALYLLTEPKKRVTKFKQLKDGEKYEIFGAIYSKTIYIRDIDEDCRPLDSYKEVLVRNEADMKAIYEGKGSALYLLTEPKERLTKFKQLKDGEKYEIFGAIYSKTIYIRDIDEDCQPLDSYTEVLVRNEADMKAIYEGKGSALYLLTEPKKRVTVLKQLKDGEKYGVFSRYEQSFSQELRWQQMEDRAMEEEVALAMKNYLHSHVGSNVIEMPTDVVGTGGNIVQEWDAAFKVDDVLYLCEAKHVMCIDKVPKIPQRIKMFKEQFQPHAQEEFSIGINKIVGVACGTYFPPLVREKAHELGLICVYPTGWRYYDDKKLPKGFKIEF